MRRTRTIFLAALVAASCLAGPAAPASLSSGFSVVGMLPLGAQVAAPASPQTGGDCISLPRATSDRPDFDSGRQVHLIYLVPADAADEGLDVDGTLECSFRAQQQWLAQQSEGLEWLLDTFLTEAVVDGSTRTVAAPDITFVESPQPAANLAGASEIRAELEARGFDDPDKRYLTYVESDGGGACGDALYPLPHLGERWGGQYAQVYLNSSEGCGSDDFGVPGAPSFAETVAQQELMHNDGMTPPGAPHGCLLGSPPGIGHVCTVAIPIPELDPERFDVMYPYAGVPLAEKKLDIGHDDYFRQPWPTEDFADSPFLRPVSERPAVPDGSAPPVSLAASATKVPAGKRVTFTGAAASCAEGADVTLEARRPADATFGISAFATTGADGTFEIRAKVRHTSVFRAVVAETEGCRGGVSPEVRVKAVRG